MICPACLTETPNVLSICIRCHGSLVSWGEKAAKQDESTAPGMPERERQESGDGTEDEKEDVEMENEDQDEIDRLVRESKRTSGEGTDDDVDMSETKPSRTQTRSGGERERTAPDHNVAFGCISAPTPRNNKKKKKTNGSPMNKNKTRSRGRPG